MQRLPIDFLEPGMVVAKQVVNDAGVVLINADTELTEGLISRLNNMKIRKIVVKGCPVSRADLIPKPLEAVLADMATGFERVGDDPLMRKYRVILKAHFIKRDKEMRGMMDDAPEKADGQEVTDGFSAE